MFPSVRPTDVSSVPRVYKSYLLFILFECDFNFRYFGNNIQQICVNQDEPYQNRIKTTTALN